MGTRQGIGAFCVALSLGCGRDYGGGGGATCPPLTRPPGMATARVIADDGRLDLRIGIVPAVGAPLGDILFLHGFADRIDNHAPLFDAWRNAGFRVIAFDYPSHGETCGRRIDAYRMKGVAGLAAFVEEKTREDDKRPLLVAGWSTGGLLAVRILEEPTFPKLGRAVAAAILIAPGVDVRMAVGAHGMVTQETLTRNPSPPHLGPIAPRSPFFTPIFASDLLWNASEAMSAAYPSTIPTLVLVGSEGTDRYVHPREIENWVGEQRAHDAHLYGRVCEGGYHELDNEPAEMGENVRLSAASFAIWATNGMNTPPPDAIATSGGGCRSF